ncbi:MAG: DEAD/DEAH box helicase [Cyanobacteria bacterium J06560_6]
MLLSKFIGINRHQDKLASDLIGAVRDATALWALFSDTFSESELEAELITDEDATASSVRAAIKDTLKRANASDMVVITFAGHGTKNHRIVAHDTSIQQLEQTSIGMDELAEWFRGSKAQAILCVLDCCFSGGASARVIEDTPTSRDIQLELRELGRGRTMITASGLKEYAYEHPTKRHGLLTAALIDAFTQQDDAFSLLAVLDDIQSSVRAEAAKIGQVQSPVVLGMTEGGLMLPNFLRGKVYLQHFPESKAFTVSKDFSGLETAGFPSSVIDVWAERFSDGLNDIQLAAINEHQILSGSSVMVVAPTSAGKTFIGELSGIKAVLEGRKAVFLFPYRALVNEKYEDFTEIYADKLGLRVIRCSGDYLDQTTEFVKSKFDIAVLTFEMFLSLSVANTGLLSRLGLVVVDEAQFIADPSRGIVVELMLAYLKRLQAQAIAPQLILLSATIGQLNGFDEWLDVQALVSDTRPVPLEFGVLDRNGRFEYLGTDSSPKIEQLLPYGAIRQRRKKPSSQDVIVPLVQQLIASDERKEKILIFRNQRGFAEGCARYIARDGNLPPAQKLVDRLPTADQSSTTEALKESLNGGTAIHSSNLTRDERVIVEQGFRDPKSNLRVLAATTTVAAGINTPASTVIIVEHDFPWEDRDMTVSQIRNMAGRAGRLGYQEAGRAILLADNAIERSRLFKQYITSEPEPIKSSFEEDNVGTWLVRLLAQAIPSQTKASSKPVGILKEDVPGLILSTFGGYLRARAQPTWAQQTSGLIQQWILRLLKDGVIEEFDSRIHLTLLGRAIAESAMSLSSSLRLVEIIQKSRIGMLSPETLMVLIQILPELDDRYIPLFKRGKREHVWPQSMARKYGNYLARLLQERCSGNQWIYYGRAKRACVLGDWVNGVPIQTIEERYTVQARYQMARGDIQGIADTTRFYLSSAYAIVSILDPGNTPEPEAMENFLTSLETGLPSALLSLLESPISLSRGECIALAGVGIRTVDEIKAANPEMLEQNLSSDTSTALQQWIEGDAIN